MTEWAAEVGLPGALRGLAVLLSGVGVYGLVSNLVAQRRSEIGISIAPGSPMRTTMLDVGSTRVIADGLGVGLGVGFSFVALRVLRSGLYGIGE